MKKRFTPPLIFLLAAILLLAGCGQPVDKSWSSGYWETVFFEDEPVPKKTDFSFLFIGSEFTDSAMLSDMTEMLFAENGITARVETRTWKLAYLNQHYADYKEGKIPEINENKYDVVVFQGIYGDKDANSALSFHSDFKENGVKSKIVLMPYHDEPSHAAKWVRDKLTDVGFCDWRGLVAELYNKGFGDSNLKNDDWLLSPNAINGYFGVMLFYIRLFDESPKHASTDSYVLDAFGEFLPGGDEAGKLSQINVALNEAKKLAKLG